MADNPEFVAKLADALAERLDNKYGWDIGEMRVTLEKVSGKLETLSQDSKRRFDNLDHNFKTFGDKQDLFERELGKINGRINSIDEHLGINTDTRRRA